MPANTGTKQSAFGRTSKNIVDFVEENVKEDDSGVVYDHQIRAVRFIQQRFQAKLSFALVSIPTGAGKSGVAVLSAYWLGCRRVLVVTPNHDLSKQIKREFRGEPKSDNSEKHPFLLARAIVCASDDNWVPTTRIVDRAYELKPDMDLMQLDVAIANRHKWTSKAAGLVKFGAETFDLVIIDEAHQMPSETILTVYNHFHKLGIFVLLLTATPFRTNKAPLIPRAMTSEVDYNRGKFHFTLAEAVAREIIREVAEPILVTPDESMNAIALAYCAQKAAKSGDDATKCDDVVDSDSEEEIVEEGDELHRSESVDGNAHVVLSNHIAVGMEIVRQLQSHDIAQPHVKHLAMIVFPNTFLCNQVRRSD